jgi:hypothetical protein
MLGIPWDWSRVSIIFISFGSLSLVFLAKNFSKCHHIILFMLAKPIFFNLEIRTLTLTLNALQLFKCSPSYQGHNIFFNGFELALQVCWLVS